MKPAEPQAVPHLPLAAAVRALRVGGVIAYPTEGVWGFGCDPLNMRACLRLLALKRRPWDKGLVLIADHFDALAPFVELPSRSAYRRAAATWPGPVTWVFPASVYAPDWITGGRDSIAVRVTAHPVAAALCRRFGDALVSTSANRSTHPPARSATELRLKFRRGIDALVPGALGGLKGPTPIRDLATGHLLRR